MTFSGRNAKVNHYEFSNKNGHIREFLFNNCREIAVHKLDTCDDFVAHVQKLDRASRLKWFKRLKSMQNFVKPFFFRRMLTTRVKTLLSTIWKFAKTKTQATPFHLLSSPTDPSLTSLREKIK